MRWQFLALLLLVALGLVLDRLSSQAPSWVLHDPLTRPFGTGVDPPGAAVDSVEALLPATAEDPVAVNVASLRELTRLPRIGPVLARRIVAFRDSLGPLESVEELERIRGIGPTTVGRLRELVTFQIVPGEELHPAAGPGPGDEGKADPQP